MPANGKGHIAAHHAGFGVIGIGAKHAAARQDGGLVGNRVCFHFGVVDQLNRKRAQRFGHISPFIPLHIGHQIGGGGGVNNTLDSELPEVRQQLRVLHETASYQPHPVVTHPSVSPAVRERFFKAFESLTLDDSGRKMLDAVGISKPVQVNYAKHYKVLEDLGLEKFLVIP
jgi:hypothetical protein